jgi:hypothetical protein
MGPSIIHVTPSMERGRGGRGVEERQEHINRTNGYIKDLQPGSHTHTHTSLSLLHPRQLTIRLCWAYLTASTHRQIEGCAPVGNMTGCVERQRS